MATLALDYASSDFDPFDWDTQTYIDYWIDNPDHFRSLYSMAGTVEDRRFPDGIYFGETEIARRGFGIFVTSIGEYLSEQGVGNDAHADAASRNGPVGRARSNFIAFGNADDEMAGHSAVTDDWCFAISLTRGQRRLKRRGEQKLGRKSPLATFFRSATPLWLAGLPTN